jgi:phosphoribosylamine--glycine ligase
MSPDVPPRILVLGGGGREHALAWRLAGETGVVDVLCAPGSPGIAATPGVRCLPVDAMDPAAVVALARAEAVDLVVVGPEAPLSVGVADALAGAGVPVFGPTRAAARLETSKAFCHEVAAAAGVRMARARVFRGEEVEPALAFIRALASDGAGIVLKADGLAAGKGVIVTDSVEMALDYAPSFLRGRRESAPALVVEERLAGPEASVIAVCDGARAVALPAARDHKRLCDDDLGPNTGGMGAYSPLPDLEAADVARIVAAVHEPILAEMRRRGAPFRGFLYAGLMLTPEGPALLEFNVRCGDPETQVILPRVDVPLAPLLLAAARGALPAETTAVLPATADAAVGIVLAARGYPGDAKRGDPIEGVEAAAAQGALVFHAGTVARQRPEGGWGTNGGRVLTVVGLGARLADARAAAERAADAISWDGVHRRHDIALRVPPKARVPA